MLEGDFERWPLQLHFFATTHLVVVGKDPDEIFLISDLLSSLLLSHNVSGTTTYYLFVDLERTDSHIIGRTAIDLILLELNSPWYCLHTSALADVFQFLVELNHLADELLQFCLLFSISFAHYLQLALDLLQSFSLFPQVLQKMHFFGKIRQSGTGSESSPLFEKWS